MQTVLVSPQLTLVARTTVLEHLSSNRLLLDHEKILLSEIEELHDAWNKRFKLARSLDPGNDKAIGFDFKVESSYNMLSNKYGFEKDFTLADFHSFVFRCFLKLKTPEKVALQEHAA